MTGDEARRREAAEKYAIPVNRHDVDAINAEIEVFLAGAEHEAAHLAGKIEELEKKIEWYKSGDLHTCHSKCTNLTCNRVREISDLKAKLAERDAEIERLQNPELMVTGEMVKALREKTGCGMLEARNQLEHSHRAAEIGRLRTDLAVAVGALEELVSLKKLKDSLGHPAEYRERQPKAWDQAREALAKIKGEKA